MASDASGASPVQGQGGVAPAKVEANAHDTTAGSTKPTAAPPALDANGEHLLETPWTFWYDHKLPKAATDPENYAEHLKKLGTISTIEGFYRVYSNLIRPSDLPKDSNFHFFRGDETPMWERFPNGGCFTLKIKKKSTPSLSLLWEQLLFAAIGEAFEEPKVVGVVLSTRSKADMLAVWNSDGQNNQIKIRMSDKLRMILHLDRNTPVEYKPNSTSIKDNSTYRNGKVMQPTPTPAVPNTTPAAAGGAIHVDKKKKKKKKAKKTLEKLTEDGTPQQQQPKQPIPPASEPTTTPTIPATTPTNSAPPANASASTATPAKST